MIGNIGGNTLASIGAMFGSQSEETRRKTLREGQSGQANAVATGPISNVEEGNKDSKRESSLSQDNANTLAAAQAQALQGASSAQA